MNYALIDLHLHLDGSLNLKWQYDRARLRKVIGEDVTFEKYYRMMLFNDHPANASLFDKFDLPCDVMQCEEDLHDACYNLVETLAKQGLIYAEIRFAPQLHTKNGLTQSEIVEAILSGAQDGMKDYPSIKINIITCMMHKGDSAAFNEKENLETIRVTKEYLGKGVCGIDLAGFENNCDFEEYVPLFEIVKKENIPFTIHAGEMGVADHVPVAVKLGAKRIGHGINAIEKEEYMQAILDNDITLEVCPTSNSGFGTLYATHPIHTFIQKGIKVTLNSDDMTFAKNNLNYEYEMMRNVGFTDEMLKQCTLNAIDAAFLSEEEKEELRKKVL